MTIGDVLMKRKSSGLTQREVTQKLNWNTETLVDIERGRLVVAEETVEQISDAITIVAQEKQQRKEREEVMTA